MVQMPDNGKILPVLPGGVGKHTPRTHESDPKVKMLA
jgi:hypothetical protein